MTLYYVKDDFREVGGIDRNLNWLVEYHLRESFDDDKKRIIAVAFPIDENRKFLDKIRGLILIATFDIISNSLL